MINLTFPTEVEYEVSFYFIERSLILTSTTLDLFYYPIVYQTDVNNTFAWILQL